MDDFGERHIGVAYSEGERLIVQIRSESAPICFASGVVICLVSVHQQVRETEIEHIVIVPDMLFGIVPELPVR